MCNLPGAPNRLIQIKVCLFSMAIKKGSRHFKRKRGRNAESPGAASECSSKIMFTPLVVWKAGGGMNNWETILERQLS